MKSHLISSNELTIDYFGLRLPFHNSQFHNSRYLTLLAVRGVASRSPFTISFPCKHPDSLNWVCISKKQLISLIKWCSFLLSCFTDQSLLIELLDGSSCFLSESSRVHHRFTRNQNDKIWQILFEETLPWVTAESDDRFHSEQDWAEQIDHHWQFLFEKKASLDGKPVESFHLNG